MDAMESLLRKLLACSDGLYSYTAGLEYPSSHMIVDVDRQTGASVIRSVQQTDVPTQETHTVVNFDRTSSDTLTEVEAEIAKRLLED